MRDVQTYDKLVLSMMQRGWQPLQLMWGGWMGQALDER